MSITIICLLILLILIWTIDKIKMNTEIKATYKVYLEYLNNAIKKSKIDTSKIINFANKVRIENKMVNLGQMIIDYKSKKILICETMLYKKGYICEPDINIVSFNKLIDCNFLYVDSKISKKQFIALINSEINKNDIELMINANIKYFFPRTLNLNITGNFDIMLKIYEELNLIIKNKH